MSEAVNYNDTSYLTQSYFRVEQNGTVIGGPYNWSAVSSRQRRYRPASKPTQRERTNWGGSYTAITSWEHYGVATTTPIISGVCIPWNLSSGSKCSYTYGVPNAQMNNGTVPSVTGMDELVNGARTKCLLRLKDQKINLGNALAEAKQTAELIGNNAKRIANLFRQAAKRNPKEWFRGVRNAGTKNWKNVPGYYLEHVYGVVPLLSDIDGACQQLAESINRGLPITVSAYGKSTDSVDEVITLGSAQYGQYKAYVTTERIARVGIVAYVPDWALQDYNALGLENPFSIAWELTPYSHVIDWFLPVGNWINTWDVGNHLQFKDGFTTRFVKSQGGILVEPPEGNPPKVWSVSNDLEGRYSGFRMVRDHLVDFPTASFPSLRNPLSLNHMAQGLAMLSQVVRGHSGRASRG